MKIKKGDTVLVTSGNDKGKRAEVVRTMPKLNKIVVKGVNMAKKHQKPRRAGRGMAQTGLLNIEMPIDVSNVLLISPSGKPTRVNYKVDGETKRRYSNKLKEELS
jgi:large subunit ribosomal protein L24